MTKIIFDDRDTSPYADEIYPRRSEYSGALSAGYEHRSLKILEIELREIASDCSARDTPFVSI